MIVSYDVDGAEKVVMDLRALAARASDVGPALRRLADLLRTQERERFDREGPGWAALADSTVARKGLSGQILVETGDLRASFTEAGGDHIEHIQRDELIFGTSDPKAAFHQRGTSKMPARPVIELGAGEHAQHAKLIQHFVVDGEDTPGYRIAIGI